MSLPYAMSSYMVLCGNELVNAARTKAYVEGGIAPPGFDIRCSGCEGLEDILPCVDETGETEDTIVPVNGYNLPELDPAPWYDPAVPESKNFAGMLVTEVTMSAPFSRTVSSNIGDGATLGRLKRTGRTIVVRGFLIGKTCCATGYGLQWLTTALAGQPCDGCAGCDLDFLDCCPKVGDGPEDCLTTVNADGTRSVYVRPDEDTEYERAESFFRTMHNVGVIDGPNVLSCRGGSCGCGCAGSLVEVEFTLFAGSPYVNAKPVPVVTDEPAPACPARDPDGECDVTWRPGKGPCDAGEADGCPPPASCLDDPACPSPPLPPAPVVSGRNCGCIPFRTVRSCANAAPTREWGESTFNYEVFAGSEPMRNVAIRVFQNPKGLPCDTDGLFLDCDACSTLLVSYIPAGGTLRVSGEERRVTIECGGEEQDAYQNVTDIDGKPFDWPDVECVSVCICVDFDCEFTADDATYSIERVDRGL